MVSSISPSTGTVGSVGQTVSSAQNIMFAPASIAQSSAQINSLSTSMNMDSGSVVPMTDVLGSRSNDAMSGVDSTPKAPFSISGAFSGLMVAVGLKDSPAELAAKEKLQAAKDFAANQVTRSLNVIVEATADSNGDADGHGFSTIFRFYALQDAAAFNKIGLEEVGGSNGLLYQEELILPNHMTQIRAKYPSDSQFIAVLFQLHNRAHRWRLLIPINRLQLDKPLRLVLGRCDVRVKDGLIPSPFVAPISTQSASSPVIKKSQLSVIETELSSVCQ